MIVSIALATVYGVFQLWVLTLFTRTVRLRTALLGVVSGSVITYPVAVALEWAWTTLAWPHMDGFQTKLEFITFAGYTVNPFIEELVRLLPLVAVVGVVRTCRRQWAIADLVVFGAAVGAGYRLAEHLARFPSAPAGYLDELVNSGGWVFGGLSYVIYAPPPTTWLLQWCPDGVQILMAPLLDHWDGFNALLIWGAMAGLAVGLWSMARQRLGEFGWARRFPWRTVAVGLIVLASLSHAALNAVIAVKEWPAGLLALPIWLNKGLGWWPVAAVVVAVGLDRMALRSSDGKAAPLLLAPRGEGWVLLRLAAQRFPVSLLAVLEFVRVRRMCFYSRLGDHHGDAELDAAVMLMADRLRSAASGEDIWTGIRAERSRVRRKRLRALAGFPVVVLVVLSLVGAGLPLLYLVIGGTESMGVVQDWFVDYPWLALAPSILALVLAALTVVLLVVRWRKIPVTIAEPRVTALLGIMNQVAGIASMLLMLHLYRSGHRLRLPIVNNLVHGLDALGSLLLVMGLIAIAAAVVFTGGLVVVGGVVVVSSSALLVAGAGMSATGAALLLADAGPVPRFELDPDFPRNLPPPTPYGGPAGPLIGIGLLRAAGEAIQDFVGSDDEALPSSTPLVTVPPPYDPETQYIDEAGKVRWRDTGMLVDDDPDHQQGGAIEGQLSPPTTLPPYNTREQYYDRDGTRRWLQNGVPIHEDPTGTAPRIADPDVHPNSPRNWLDEAAIEKVPAEFGDGIPTRSKLGWRWFGENMDKEGIRIDRGNPNSEFASQQVDHVIVRYEGEVIGRDGQPIKEGIGEEPLRAHVPLDEWLGWETWHHP